MTMPRRQKKGHQGCAIDHVTILSVAPGKLASKRICRDKTTGVIEIQNYDAGHLFGVLDQWPVRNIHDLSDLLKALEELPAMLVIRGSPVTSDMARTWVRRTGSGDGENHVGNFRTPDVGRCYVLIDVDDYLLPADWTLHQGNVQDVLKLVIQQLPKEFQDVSFHWQLSSSAGVGDPTKVSLHLWFWLITPVPDEGLKAWGKQVNADAGFKLVDTALFQHVQAHYTAAPTFEGMSDPFPTRSGLVLKEDMSVDLNLQVSTAISVGPSRPTTAPGPVRGGSGFDYHLAQIGDHAGGDGFHGPTLRAAASYVASHGADGTDVETLYAAISDRVLNADASRHTKSQVTAAASREHIVPVITSALEKYGKGDRRQKARLHKDQPAHFRASTISALEAQQQLQTQIDKVF
jgi:hypothetical protein